MAIESITNHPLSLYPDFRNLFIGRFVSAVGDKFFAIALAWWVISDAGADSKLHLGLLMGMNFVPIVLFGPFLGTLADRMNKRTAMLAADFFRMALVAALCVLLYANALTLPALYSLCFFIAAFIPLFESSVSSALIRLTSEEHLSSATVVDSSVSQLSGVAGSALGSVLIAAVGVIGAFSLNAFSFLVSFIAVWIIKTDLSPAEKTRNDYMAEMKEGFRYITGNREILYLLSTFAAFNFFVAPILILMPMLVKFTLGESATWLAVFEVFFALGSVITAALMSLKQGYSKIYESFFASLLLIGFSFFGLKLTADKYVMCGLLLLAGSALAWANGIAMMLFQRIIPDGMKGRFFAALNTLVSATIPLAFIATGILAEKTSISFVIAFNGISILLLSFSILLIPRIEAKL